MSSERGALADYLRARRAELRPEDVGYPRDAHRRVSGLRRSELAELAGISAEYYTRLEQGRAYQMSEAVLGSLARALRLDDAATAYFYRIALPAPPRMPVPLAGPVSDLVVRLVEEWAGSPVYVADRNMDVLLSNDLAAAMFPGILTAGSNVLESVFSTPREGRGLGGWSEVAMNAVAALRFQSDPADPRLHEIVGGLSVRDADFRRMWANHAARPLSAGAAPVVIDGLGFGEIPWQALDVPGGYTMIVYLAPAGSFAARAIDHLKATLAATMPESEVA